MSALLNACQSPAATETTRNARYFCPHVDIREQTDELVLVADMPGAQLSGIEIGFADGELTLQAEIPSRRVEGATYLLEEYNVGGYYRTFHVSEQIDPAQISAEYQAGVLTVHLPKAASARPHKVSVTAGA